MQRSVRLGVVIALLVLALLPSTAVLAQQKQPQDSSQDFVLFTRYPAQESEIGKSLSLPLTLRTDGAAQTVHLEVQQLPEGWTAAFRGSGHIVQAVYVDSGADAKVDLRLDPPADEAAGTYRFVVVARGENFQTTLPLELTVKDKLPPSLSLTTDLPTLKGTPKTTFRYNATLKNEGDEDLTVNLVANAPDSFQVTFKLSAQEVTSLPLKAGETKRLSIEAKPFADLEAGQYPLTVRAQGGEAEAALDLTAEVTGQPQLALTTPDNRLSGQAYAGRETTFKFVLQNQGTAPATNVKMSATQPTGWTVEFDPKTVDEVPAGKQVEVSAKMRPADKAVAGDYMVTVRSNGDAGVSKSVEFRVTVLTSTLWGVVGIGLIAVAVAVVALAVVRFGRR